MRPRDHPVKKRGELPPRAREAKAGNGILLAPAVREQSNRDGQQRRRDRNSGVNSKALRKVSIASLTPLS